MIWIGNCTNFTSLLITHAYHTFKGGLAEAPLTLGHEWVIFFHFYEAVLLIYFLSERDDRVTFKIGACRNEVQESFSGSDVRTYFLHLRTSTLLCVNWLQPDWPQDLRLICADNTKISKMSWTGNQQFSGTIADQWSNHIAFPDSLDRLYIKIYRMRFVKLIQFLYQFSFKKSFAKCNYECRGLCILRANRVVFYWSNCTIAAHYVIIYETFPKINENKEEHYVLISLCLVGMWLSTVLILNEVDRNAYKKM